MLHRIEQELQIHTALEEDILYPAIKEAGGKEEAKMYYEAKEEHRTVDSLVLPDLLHTETGTLEFAGRVKVMKELLEHHIEEEEGELFPTAKKLLGKAQLEELGQAMVSRVDPSSAAMDQLRVCQAGARSSKWSSKRRADRLKAWRSRMQMTNSPSAQSSVSGITLRSNSCA